MARDKEPRTENGSTVNLKFMRIASIDIGTNTCNLVIAEYNHGEKLQFLHKEKQAITLINKDFHNNNISHDSVSNLIAVLNTYKKTIIHHHTDKIVTIATSGVRSAANREHVVDRVQKESGLEIRIIDGNTEAEFAWKGVKNAVVIDINPVLIIDIGGGSIEFIICDKNGIIWKKSYDIGVARLLANYDFSDPHTLGDIDYIYILLNSELSELIEICLRLKLRKLIGSSGSYETFANLIKYECPGCNIEEINTFNIIDIDKFFSIYSKLVTFNEAQRTLMPGMDLIRVKMIPIAAAITKFLLEKLEISSFVQSNYSIKEGILYDFIEKLEK